MHSPYAVILALVTVFCASFKGAYDLWSSLVYTLVVLATLSFWFLRSAWRSETIPISPWVPVGIGGLGLAASLVSPIIPAESWTIYPSWVAALLVFPIAVYAFERDDAFDSFLRFLVPFFWVQAAFVLREQVIGGFIDQSPGLLYDANASAAFHVAWIPVLADKVIRSKQSPYWTIGLIAAVAGFAGAQSVWGWIALSATLPWFFPQRFGRKEKSAVALIVCVLALWKFSASSDRFGWWMAGLRMFADHPFAGVGLGGYPGAFLAYRVGDGLNTTSPHSVVIQLLAETGIFGFGAICWMGAVLFKGRKPLPESRRGMALGAGALLLFSLVSVCFEIPVNLLTLSILMGAVCSGHAVRSAIPRKAVAVAVVVMAIAITPFLLAPLQASRLIVSGKAALQVGDSETAGRLFENASSLDSRSFEARRWEARAAFAVEGAEEAVALQREAIGLNPLNGVLWMELGTYLSDTGYAAEAKAADERAVLLSSGLLPPRR